MVTGADSIEDLDVLRHGGMPVLFGSTYAPSALGSFLREFTFGHVHQLGGRSPGVPRGARRGDAAAARRRAADLS